MIKGWILFWIGLFSCVCFGSTESIRDPFVIAVPAAQIQQTLWIPIHYAEATTIADFLNHSQRALFKSHSYIAADKRTNQILVHAILPEITLIKQLLKQIDVPIATVLIKARLISADQHFLHSLGILLGSAHHSTTTDDRQLVRDLPGLAEAAGHVTIPIVKLADGHLLDLTLSALEEKGQVKLLSSPELMTSNREPAMIESGEEVPYQEKTGEGNTSIAFKKATLRLQVTPIVLPNHDILLQLAVNQDKISSLLVNGVPAIRTQQLSTAVLLKDQETIVLGGIYEELDEQSESGIPGLYKIPVLGRLFREQRHQRERKQLLILITPKIIDHHNMHFQHH